MWLKRKEQKSIQDNRKLHHILKAEALKETGSPLLVLNSIIITVVLLFVIIVWCSFTQVIEVATAEGSVVPQGEISIIQHLEGGIISDIHVNNGETVIKKQKLVTMNPSDYKADFKRLQTKQLSLSMDIFRLKKYLQEQTLTLPEFQASIKKPFDFSQDDYNKLMSNSISLFNEQFTSRKNKRNNLKKTIKQLNLEVDNLKARKQTLSSRRDIMQEQVNIYQQLRDQKNTSKVSLLSIKERHKSIEGEYYEVEVMILKTQIQLDNAIEELKTFNSKLKQDSLQQIAELDAELLSVLELLKTSSDRVNRLVVTSPINGVVKGLKLDKGSVVSPGGIILEIVPLDEDLFIEAKVNPTDIAYVKVGNDVNVKISAYNFTIYGQITGEIVNISASTFLNDNNEPYYKAMIRLDKNYFGEDPKFNHILPGMTATADIVTGDKTLISYLLKPIKRAFAQSFRER